MLCALVLCVCVCGWDHFAAAAYQGQVCVGWYLLEPLRAAYLEIDVSHQWPALCLADDSNHPHGLYLPVCVPLCACHVVFCAYLHLSDNERVKVCGNLGERCQKGFVCVCWKVIMSFAPMTFGAALSDGINPPALCLHWESPPQPHDPNLLPLSCFFSSLFSYCLSSFYSLSPLLSHFGCIDSYCHSG